MEKNTQICVLQICLIFLFILMRFINLNPLFFFFFIVTTGRGLFNPRCLRNIRRCQPVKLQGSLKLRSFFRAARINFWTQLPAKIQPFTWRLDIDVFVWFVGQSWVVTDQVKYWFDPQPEPSWLLVTPTPTHLEKQEEGLIWLVY